MALLTSAPAASESVVLFRRWRRFSDRAAQERARKVLDAQGKVSAQTGHPPTVSELPQYLDVFGLQPYFLFGFT